MKVAGSMDRPIGFGGPGDTASMRAVPDEPLGAAVGLAEPPPPGPYDGPAEEFPGGAGPRRSGGDRAGMRIAAVVAGAAVVIGGGAVGAFALTGGDGKATVSASPRADAAEQPPVDPYVEQQQRRKLAFERAARAARQNPAKRPVLMPKGKPIPTKKPKPEEPSLGSPVPAGEAQRIAKAMLPDFGFDPSTQFGCLVALWDKESGWNHRASNPSSGAYGIPQALPGSKMASAGDDWRTNPRTQIKWGLGYIKNRYGSPCKAWSHSKSVGWY